MSESIAQKSKLDSDLLFKIAPMKPVIKTTRPHGHRSYFELIFLTDGGGRHWIDVDGYDIVPNALYIIQPGQVHFWEMTAIPSGYVVMFRDDFLIEHHLSAQDLAAAAQALNGRGLSPEQAGQVLELLRHIEAEYLVSGQDSGKILASYLNILILRLKSWSDNGHSVPKDPTFLQRFRTLVDTHFRTSRQVQYYADLLAISPKYLNDQARKAAGITASDLIDERVVLEAKRLLLHTDLTIAQVTFDLGLQDPSHFSKFFIRKTGISPSDYRESIR